VYGEYRKGQSDPDQVVFERLQGAAFTEHTYRHDTIGYEADIAAMPNGTEDARVFFDRWYRPEHAHLLVVGDVDAESAHAAVARAFGGWKAGTRAPARAPSVEPRKTTERRVVVPWTGSAAPRLSMAWKIPAHDATNPDTAGLEIAAEMLRAETGDLQRLLVRDGRRPCTCRIARGAAPAHPFGFGLQRSPCFTTPRFAPHW